MTTLTKQCLEESAARTFSVLGALTAALGFAVAAGPAHAAPVVINGGFETGDFTGWTETGDNGFDGVQCPGPGPSVFQGNCSAFFGPVAATGGGISQMVTSLIVGDKYNVSFALEPDGNTPSFFSASFGGVNLINLNNLPISPYQLFRFTTTATATSEPLSFTFRDEPGFMRFDAVSVAAAVPEPATVALLGIGLAGLWAGRRRKAQ